MDRDEGQGECVREESMMFECLRDAFGPMNTAFDAPKPKKKARDASHHKKAAPVWQSYQNSIDTADSASAEGVTANMHV